MTPTSPIYSISQLADLAGVSVRTVRYYVSQGLLPSVVTPGPGAKYGQAHLARLRLIRRLQEEHLPLAEIRRRLEHLDDETVIGLAEQAPTAPAPASALDYIRAVIGDREGYRAERRIAGSWPAPASAPELASPPAYNRLSLGLTDLAAPSTETTPTLDRSQWERVSLAPDIELHLRRPLDRRLARRVERVIAMARELLEEDPS